MQGILHEEPSILQFLLITCIIGGWTAWRTGKSVADGWQTYTTVVVYTLLLGVAIRFVHHALFGAPCSASTTTSWTRSFFCVFSTAGFRFYRTRQMTTSYYWLYEKPRLSAGRQMKGTPAGFRRIKRQPAQSWWVFATGQTQSHL